METATSEAGLRMRKPAANLAGFVDRYWTGLDNRDSSVDIVPDGCIDIVVHVDGATSAIWAYGTSTRLKREAIGPGDYFGIRFLPGMARFFLDVPASELTDRREIVTREVAFGLEVLEDCAEPAELFSRIDRAMAGHLARRQPRLSAIDAAIRSIAASHGASRIGDVAEATGKSRRQFERDFLLAVGLPAKQFGVISRFQHALTRLDAQPAASLAAIAADCGYADQSHMVRDFQRLGGTSPSRWPGRVAFVQDA